MRRRSPRPSPALSLATMLLAGVLGVAHARPAHAAAAKAPSANDVARARALDREGVRAYKEERYNDAIRYFTEAFKLGGPPSELWNIAKCQERLDNPEEASRSLEEYLAQPGLTPADRAEASQQLQEIKHRHSTLTVASSPPGASVYVDGKRSGPAGATPLSLDVAPGNHSVAVEHPGYEPYTRSIDASYGRAIIVDAQLSRRLDEPATARERGKDDATAPPPPHRVILGAAIGAAVPRFGSVGGSAGVAGFFDATYVLRDARRVVAGVGLRLVVNGEGWSNTIGATAAPDGGCTLTRDESATAFSALVAGVAAYRVSSRVRVGGELGLGLAAYRLDRAGGDVFVPTCRSSPGVKPAVLVGASVSYAFSRDLRLTLLPIVIEAQAAFQGARTTPTDASGTWLRFGAGLGVAFDLF
jgi:hypothetical protein